MAQPRRPTASRSSGTSARPHGFTAIELIFAVALVATMSGMAVPPVLRAIDDYRAIGAARFLATKLQRVRMEAVQRSSEVAVRFAGTPGGYVFATYVDGNGDGVLSRDIAAGIDQPLGAPERLTDTFAGVDIGVEPGLPPVEPGGTAPGSDPVRLGSGDMASFSPAGSSSSGSVYVRGRSKQLVVRIYGDTGKTRVLVFDPRVRQWKGL